MTARIISVFNEAGGVGKSTVTMNVGYHLALLGKQVLLLDMDPQGSLSDFMGLETYDLPVTMYHVLTNKAGGELPLYRLHGMDLLPSNLRLARAEPELMAENMREMRLRQIVNPLRSQYDFILLDCPPSLGLLSTLSLISSDSVLVPIETEYKALKGTDILLETIGEMREAKKLFNETLAIEGFLPTKFDARKNQHMGILQSILMSLVNDGPVFLQVPDRAELPSSNQAHEPLHTFSKRCDALIAFTLVAHHLAGEPVPTKTAIKLATWAKTGKIIPEMILDGIEPHMIDNLVLPSVVTETLHQYAQEVGHVVTP